MSIAWYVPFQIPLLTPHFTIFFPAFRITLWPMWLANSKRQPCFLSTSVTRTRRQTELTKKLTNLMGNLCCAEKLQFRFSCSFFTQFNLECMEPFSLATIKCFSRGMEQKYSANWRTDLQFPSICVPLDTVKRSFYMFKIRVNSETLSS